MTALKELLDNHLAFLATHRGSVTRSAGFVLVDSTSPEFTCAFADDAASLAELPPRFEAVRLLPWSRLADTDLVAAGYERALAFTYMTLRGALRLDAPRADLDIAVVADARGMDVFTDVQTRAFLEPGEPYDAWFAWLKEKNDANLRHDAQRFYLGSVAGTAAGVTLAVRSGGLGGIYAVATLPAFRKRGVSTALLARAVRDARTAGAETITLQVKTGAYAESLYAKLGFVEAFVSPVFVRRRARS